MQYRAEAMEPEKLAEERKEFALKLREAILSGRLICYVDETSFNGWVRKPKAWFVSTKKFEVPLSKKRGHGQTLFGAIFSHSTRFITHIGRSTNIADFKAFLEKLVPVLPERVQNKRKPMILLDSKSKLFIINGLI